MTHGQTQSTPTSPGPATQDLTALTAIAVRTIGPGRDPERTRRAHEILQQIRALGRELTPTEHRRAIERLESL